MVLLDQGIPRDAATILRERGFDCTHVGEIGMAKAADPEILALARERDAIIVTLDADFHAFLAVSSARGPSVIRLRVQGLDGLATAMVILKTIENFHHELSAGALVTVKSAKTTCRRLPIGNPLD
jgi:predicted nuclease of predicted toxin-antitoxin system